MFLAESIKSLREDRQKIRYVVVGLGHIAQVAVLPAFRNAKENSELVGIVSGDQDKRQKLSRKYHVPAYGYEQYEQCLRATSADAVYIATPNHLHRPFVVKAAHLGIHSLCEKPLGITEEDCEVMIETAKKHRVQLMTAYRLHFEEANLKTLKIVQSGKIGKPKIFSSVFTMQVREGNIRLEEEYGGGTLYDIGIYCINAARMLFAAEPYEAIASSVREGKRFREVDQMTSAVLRFPDERMASFVCSFDAAPVSSYRIVGTKGNVMLDPAYEYIGRLTYTITVNGKSHKKTFRPKDQFAPELIYFSECIKRGKRPEPSGMEGLADIRVIRALYQSAKTGKPVKLGSFQGDKKPAMHQMMKKPAVKKPKLVHAASASGKHD